MAQRHKQIENIEIAPKAASTVYRVGDWLQWDGSGHVVPLTTIDPVAGLCQEPIAATDADYTSTRQIHVDLGIQPNDRFLMAIGTGTAIASMIGSTFDVDGSNSGSLDVSGAGTQFRVTQVLSTTLVEVAVSKYAVDAT